MKKFRHLILFNGHFIKHKKLIVFSGSAQIDRVQTKSAALLVSRRINDFLG